MRRLPVLKEKKTALENEVIAVDTMVEPAVVEADEAASMVSDELDGANEASSILDSTLALASTVKNSLESHVGLDKINMAILSSSLEHFYDRMCFDGVKLSSLSLESFADKDTSLTNTKLVLEEIQEFNIRLENGLTIAQEGILSRLGNSLKLLFTSREKIQEKLMSATNDIEQRGSKTEVIKEPGWGRSFAAIGKKVLTSDDVINHVDKYRKLVTSNEFYNIIEAYIRIVTDLTEEVAKSRFIARDESIQRINEMITDMNPFITKVNEFLVNNNVKTAKNDPSFEPIDSKDAKRLSKDALEMMQNTKLRGLIERMWTVIGTANFTIWTEANTRLAGTFAGDIRATRTLIFKLNPVMDEIITAIQLINRTCFACANYIKASTK